MSDAPGDAPGEPPESGGAPPPDLPAPSPQTRDGAARAGRWMAIGAWVIVLGFGTVLAQRALDAREARLAPVVAGDATSGYRLELMADRRGHFTVEARINGQPARFLVDTGASGIALPQALADRLGLKRGRPFEVRTAAGPAIAWQTSLDTLEVGPFQRQRIAASISPDMGGETGLLGMTFLADLELVQRDGRLTLREP